MGKFCKLTTIIILVGAFMQESGWLSHGVPSQTCTDCHYDERKMTSIHKDGSKFAINKNNFESTAHGTIGCQTCHQGTSPSASKEAAHKNIIAKPSDQENINKTCAMCHSDIVKNYKLSLHGTIIGQRLSPEHNYGKVTGGKLVKEYCTTCHASCSDCHMKRMDKASGHVMKDIKGHRLQKKVDMWACVDCHTQTGYTFTGWRDNPPSVHYRAGLDCMACHDIGELHGDGKQHKTMKTAVKVTCDSCHKNDKAIYKDFPIVQYNVTSYVHATHDKKLQCAACHTGWYMNCKGCHLQEPPTYKVDEISTEHFYLGRDSKGLITTMTKTPLPEDLKGYPTTAYLAKVRHSWTEKAKDCEFCHTNADVYPNKGHLLSGSFIDDKTLKRVIIDIAQFKKSVHGELGLGCKDCHQIKREKKCLECHQRESIIPILGLAAQQKGNNGTDVPTAVLFHYDPKRAIKRP